MNKEEIKQKDKEDKAIKFYTNYIQAQEKELEWMYRQNEEYYRDEIEQKELLIKGFRTILNLIQKQEKIIDKYKNALVNCDCEICNQVLGECSIKSNPKQESIIDKMAEQLEKCKNEIDVLSEGNIDCFIPNEYSNIDDCIKKPTCKECIKEYFKKEVEKE